MAIMTSLANQLLIATPMMADANFTKSVIYVCEHNEQGAVGLIINHPLQFPLGLVFDQLHIEPIRIEINHLPLLYGGPLQPERGFVIHRQLGSWRSSLALREGVTVTTSSDIIRAIAADHGPKDVLVTLGFVGWGGEQLAHEVQENHWLVCPYNAELLYEVPFEERWSYAGLTIGVKMNELTSSIGHA